MALIDRDLASIQAARNLIHQAHEAQKALQEMSQEQLDHICKAICDAGMKYAEPLGVMAYQETGFGRPEHKKIKNEFASSAVYESIKDLKTVGIIHHDQRNKIIEISMPIGVIAALIPSTNPTSTVIYKAMIALKAGNAIVFSPHPGAFRCIAETVKVIKAAAVSVGCPEDAIACLELLTLQSTNELMRHEKIALILATGGNAMVKAAYSSGNPAIGVGPGNGPAFIEKSANIKLAVKQIIDSKTFDNGTICASEQSIIVERESADQVITELKRRDAYFLNDDEKEKIGRTVIMPNGMMNPKTVGKTAAYVANLAGFQVPSRTSVLIGFETKVGKGIPFSQEKLCPVLGFYIEENWENACARAIELLSYEGSGHTMSIHSNNEEIIREFALKKPVNRLLINTPAALGGIGATTNLVPSLTLGCGAIGGSSSSDNISSLHLVNIRRVAYGVRELEDLTGGSNLDHQRDIDAIVKAIVQQLQK